MQTQLSCPLCSFEFSDDKTPRILSTCGHTFCQQCLQTLIVPNEDKFQIVCPQDDICSELTSNEMKQFPINKVLLKIIESNKSKSSFKDSSFDVSKIVKQQQLQEDEQTKELISAIQQSQQEESQLQAQKSQQSNPTQVNNSTMYTEVKKYDDSVKKQQLQEEEDEEEDQNICLLHQKPLEVVCVVDLEKICAKCALFGKHKGHDFKSLEEIEQENNTFYNQLLAVYDEKSVVLNRVENKETKPDLLSILSVNKQNLTKQIKERYKKLVDAIRVEEKKALSKLDKFAQKIEKDIDQLYNIDPSLIEKYEEWQRRSFQKLQIIEKGTFEEKLQLLIVQQTDQEMNIIVQGNALVNKIRNQQNEIFTKAELFLTNMKMKTNDKIFELVENYVEVYDKLPQPPKQAQPVVPAEKQKNSNFLIYQSGKKHSEDDLLDIGENQDRPKYDVSRFQMEFRPSYDRPRSVHKQENSRFDESKFVPNLQSKIFEEEEKPPVKQEVKPETKRSSEAFTVEELKKKVLTIAPESNFTNAKNEDSFSTQKVTRPPKKKLKSIKVPEKYEKVLDGLYADNSQTFDLTNAQLGDTIILQICEFIPGTKLKTIKFIRNKLTDDCVMKMLPYLGNVITLNLSQNLLTERVLDIFIDNREMLPKVKNIILSLNKIIERKHKNKIDELRKFDITVSV